MFKKMDMSRMNDVKENDHVIQRGWQAFGKRLSIRFLVFHNLRGFNSLVFFLTNMIKFDSSDPKKGFLN